MSETPLNDALMNRMAGQSDGTHLLALDQLARTLETVAQGLADALADAQLANDAVTDFLRPLRPHAPYDLARKLSDAYGRGEKALAAFAAMKGGK